jgi:hypothetical protein
VGMQEEDKEREREREKKKLAKLLPSWISV